MYNKMLVFAVAAYMLAAVSYAAPSISILSPQNATYNATKILINVTSNETVDFYFTGMRNSVVARNATGYVSNIFGKTGSYTFTIFANNSGGEASANVSYTINHSNPVYIDSDAYLASSNTEYIVINDIGQLQWQFPVYNISVDMGGFHLTSYAPINAECARSTIFNGKLISTDLGIVLDFSNGCLFENITVDTPGVGVLLYDADRTEFRNMNITANVGFMMLLGSSTATIKNATIRKSEQSPSSSFFDTPSALQHAESGPDRLTLEEVNMTGFEGDILWVNEPVIPEYIMRNTRYNFSEDPGFINGPARLYKQHLVLINTTDQDGNGVPSIVEISDNSSIPLAESDFYVESNPTDGLLIATDENGTAQVWITEKLSLLRVESPLTVTDYVYSPYIIDVKTRNGNTTTILNAVGNSTFRVNLSMTFSEGSLPECTLTEMLDLNNDSNVDIQDATMLLRKIVGLPVNITSAKNCNGLNLAAG